MKHNIIHLVRTLPRLTFFAIFISLVAVGSSCKSKKKAMEVTDKDAVERARLEKEAALRKQQEAEALRKREADEAAARRAEEEKKNAPYTKLAQYFSSISSATSTEAANNSINEALGLFSSPDTPVLIVIHEQAGQKDYDRPTTIKEYLNYLKDQKKKADKIGTLKFDASGKINEVELIK